MAENKSEKKEKKREEKEKKKEEKEEKKGRKSNKENKEKNVTANSNAVNNTSMNNNISNNNNNITAAKTVVSKEDSDKKDKEIATPQNLSQAESELIELINKKRKVDRALVNLEASIYAFEGSYLEDTSQFGNIIKGFDGYLSNRTDKKKVKFNEDDRLFSQSSATYQAALEIKQREENILMEENNNNHEPYHKKVSIKKKKYKVGEDREKVKKARIGRMGKESNDIEV